MSKQLRFLAAPAALGLVLSASPPAAAAGDSHDSVTFQMVVSGWSQVVPSERARHRENHSGGACGDHGRVGAGTSPQHRVRFLCDPGPQAAVWYQGDIETDKHGRGHQHFIGRFSVETFAVAPGSAPAPVVFDGPFTDASVNPPFNPLQMYRLGLWFDSPEAAQAPGCPNAETPFNGEHTAGIQVLNTSNFPDDHGPLRDVIPEKD
jgi:hypothetical protein